MDTRLVDLATARGGIITTEEAARLAFPPGHLGRLARRGRLVRLRRGAYALPRVWSAAAPTQRYALRTRAVLRTREGVAASHRSALVLAGVPDLLVPGEELTHLDVVEVGGGLTRVRTKGELSVHPCPDGATMRVDALGDPHLDVSAALAQVARDDAPVAFAVALDQALRLGLTSVSEVGAALDRVGRGGQWLTQARALLLDADPLSPSPAATRLRILLEDMGLEPRRRVPLPDAHGELLVRPELLIGNSVAVVRTAYSPGVLERLREVGVVVAVVPDEDVGHPERVAATIALAMNERSALSRKRAS